MPDYYCKAGQPIDVFTWAALFKDDQYRSVGQTTVGETLISTVWLGVDHNLFGDGPPLIFETMCFGPGWDDIQERYATLLEAQLGHTVMVQRVKKALAWN